MNTMYTAERGPQIILSLLKSYGIRKVIASPGTTNISLVLSMQNDSWFEMYSSVDERSAAYMACGMAAETGEAVVLTCTGATASRNYISGLTEAFYRKLPILAVTSNQGRDKVGHLVPQNVDRSQPPHDAAVLSVNVPIVRNSEDIWNCEIQINRALTALTRHGGGPVHIDLATTYTNDFSVMELPQARRIRYFQDTGDFPELPKGRVAVFVGSHAPWASELVQVIENFCRTHDAVVFGDHTCGYNGRYRVTQALVFGQQCHDSPIKSVDLLIHIGEVSGDYYGMGIRAGQVWRVSPDGEMRDLFHKLTHVFECSELNFFAHYAGTEDLGDSYLQLCRAEYDKVYDALPEVPFSNIWMARHLHDKIPHGAVVHFGILNTLRAWSLFPLDASVTSFSNVGGFGIDGDVSAIIGASLASPSKLFFGFVGDLAFFYDLNSMGNRYVGSNVRILLINNGCGTEFRNYGHRAHAFGENAAPFIAAEGHFGHKSCNLVRHYAEDLGYEYLTASSKEEFDAVTERFIIPEVTDKPMIFEVFTNPKDESDALQTALNVIRDASYMRKSCLKNAAKTLLGTKGVEMAKVFLKRK